jgi:Thiamine pyrophosphate enzyme, N-terminal TPP binding domain
MMFRQERGALMAADGLSRLNNRKTFGVVITPGGPGAENAMGGLAQAYGDNVPILYFAGRPALNQRDVRPNFSPVRTYQTVSVSGEVIWKSDMVAAVLRRAFHRLRNGRPGPVIVEVPNDVGTQDVPAASFPYQSPKPHPQAPSSGAVREAIRLLSSLRSLLRDGRAPARVRAPRRMMAPGTLRIRRVLVDNEPYFSIVAGDGRSSEAEALAATGRLASPSAGVSGRAPGFGSRSLRYGVHRRRPADRMDGPSDA